MALFTGKPHNAQAQDPTLPPTNLGLANVFDGIAGKPGFLYQGYAQLFQTRAIYDQNGHKAPTDLKINSLVTLHQFIYLSKIKVGSGNLGFTTIIPVAQVSASSTTGNAPSTNPKAWGDIITGTAIQWSDKKLFGKPFSHRTELDISWPVGAYTKSYAINPSAHLYSFGLYHAFTLQLNKQFSISARNQFNYNTHIIGTKARPGAFYNGNYSVDYALLPSLRIEAAAYFLGQLQQDSYDGHSDYYATQYGINNTRERVLGYGPGLAYFFPGGGLMEVKGFFETAVKNRPAGFRSTVRVAIPLSK
ncbi:protein involved in meta-pathway of phenol degradation [Filimonas lacunae]|nr:protein involved in meta-pathway of phenol degradation [Filimonas lacunae]